MTIISSLIIKVLVLFSINGLLSYVHKKCYMPRITGGTGLRYVISAAIKPVADRLTIMSFLVLAMIFYLYCNFPTLFIIVPGLVGFIRDAYNFIKNVLTVILDIIVKIKDGVDDVIDKIKI